MEPEPQPTTRGVQKLEPIEPEEAAQMYLDSRADELADRSLELHERHLTSFTEWCEQEGIENLNRVSARNIHSYRISIKDGFSSSTLSIYLSTMREFMRFCQTIEAVQDGLAEKIPLPKRGDNSRDVLLDPEEAEEILTYLRKFHYASRTHALITLLWHTGIRTGTLQGLDVADFDVERERLRICHRPETDTPLKNGEAAERYIALSPETTTTIADYIDTSRHDVTDEYGRKPLLTTKNSRPHKNSIRRNIYAATRPCTTGRGCPHGRDQDVCEAAQRSNAACKCPSTVSGHPIRRGAITHFLRKDVPDKVVSDRMNVSQDVLEKHYDRRTESEKAEQRRQYLTGI